MKGPVIAHDYPLLPLGALGSDNLRRGIRTSLKTNSGLNPVTHRVDNEESQVWSMLRAIERKISCEPHAKLNPLLRRSSCLFRGSLEVTF